MLQQRFFMVRLESAPRPNPKKNSCQAYLSVRAVQQEWTIHVAFRWAAGNALDPRLRTRT